MSKTGFLYYSGMVPPAPLVQVTLAAPGGTELLSGLNAQLDTGAFKSVIPKSAVDQLELNPVRELMVEGLNGVVSALTTYLIELTIKDLSPIVVEALASDGEPRVLLGREVLNKYTITLDGPALKLIVEEP